MCRWGTSEIVHLAYPRPVSGRTRIAVDACLAPLVQALNDLGVKTTGCCCGHGGEGSVTYEHEGIHYEIFIPARANIEMLAAPDMVEALPNLPCLHVQGGDYRPHYRADEVHRYIAVCRERERIIRDSSSVEPSHCSGEIRPNDPVPESTRLATGLILKWQNQELSISAGDYDVIADDLAEFLKEYV